MKSYWDEYHQPEQPDKRGYEDDELEGYWYEEDGEILYQEVNLWDVHDRYDSLEEMIEDDD